MGKCKVCGKSGLFLKLDKHGKCKDCAYKTKTPVNGNTIVSDAQNFNEQSKKESAEEWLFRVNPNYVQLKDNLAHQDKLLKTVIQAKEDYKVDNDINKLIVAYEYAMVKATPPLKNAQYHAMYLADLYIKTNQFDKAWDYLITISLPYMDITHKIRFAQCKILKKEKRFIDAMITLMEGHLFKAQINSIFAKEAFIKEATPIASKLGLNNDKVEYFAYLIENQVEHCNFDDQALRNSYKKALSDFGVQ